jgi:yeast amino acid transporter
VFECPCSALGEALSGYRARSYIGIPIFAMFYVSYKVFYRTRVIPLKEVDLLSGKREIDMEEEKNLAEEALEQKGQHGPQSAWRKIWDSI